MKYIYFNYIYIHDEKKQLKEKSKSYRPIILWRFDLKALGDVLMALILTTDSWQLQLTKIDRREVQLNISPPLPSCP